MDQDNAVNRNVLFATTAINDGNFHHVAIVREGTTAFLYIDGALDTSYTTSGITDIANSVELIAGKSRCTGIDGTQFFAGTLDELDLFHRALSGNEIQAIYYAGSAGKCKPPLPPLPPTIEELLERIEALEHHTHTYLTGRGMGHNETEAETGPPEAPEE